MQFEFASLIGGLCLLALAALVGARRASPHSGFGAIPWAHEALAFSSTKYFSALDGLRAISVLAVIWYHVSGRHDIHILTLGNKGVDLFFAISGFLVTTLLLREHRAHGAISLRDFYIRRSLRIVPLYYAVLGIYCLLVFLSLKDTPKAAEFWTNLPAFLTYTTNWFVSDHNSTGHGVTFYFAWSLATEEQFYLFWPALLVLLFTMTRHTWTVALVAALLVAVRILAAGQVDPGFSVRVVASLASAILFGAMFAALLHSPRGFSALYPVLAHRLMAPAALAALLASLQFGGPGTLTRFLMALLVACLCIREDTVLHPVLRWKPAVFIGTISYGVYLMHMLAANIARKLLGHESGLDVFALTTVLVCAMAFASFKYYETPFLRLKARFTGGARPVVGPGVATP